MIMNKYQILHGNTAETAVLPPSYILYEVGKEHPFTIVFTIMSGQTATYELANIFAAEYNGLTYFNKEYAQEAIQAFVDSDDTYHITSDIRTNFYEYIYLSDFNFESEIEFVMYDISDTAGTSSSNLSAKVYSAISDGRATVSVQGLLIGDPQWGTIGDMFEFEIESLRYTYSTDRFMITLNEDERSIYEFDTVRITIENLDASDFIDDTAQSITDDDVIQALQKAGYIS